MQHDKDSFYVTTLIAMMFLINNHSMTEFIGQRVQIQIYTLWHWRPTMTDPRDEIACLSQWIAVAIHIWTACVSSVVLFPQLPTFHIDLMPALRI